MSQSKVYNMYFEEVHEAAEHNQVIGPFEEWLVKKAEIWLDLLELAGKRIEAYEKHLNSDPSK